MSDEEYSDKDLNNINNHQDTIPYNQNTQKTENRSRIYISADLNQRLEKDKKTFQKNQNKQFTFNKYFIVISIAVLLYVCCAWLSEVSIPEIVDLEIPFLVAVSLIITYFCENVNNILTYIIFFIIVVLVYLFVSPQYAFLLVLPLLSQLFIDCINKIYTNKKDYQVELSSD